MGLSYGGHYSRFANTGFKRDGKQWGDIMFGSTWRMNSDRTFKMESLPSNFGFSNMTLYLMGLLPASQVDDMELIIPEDPKSSEFRNLKGTIKRISIDDIIKKHGPRTPNFKDSQKDFSTAYILVTKKGESKKSVQSHAKIINSIAQYFPQAWSLATDGRSTMNKSTPIPTIPPVPTPIVVPLPTTTPVVTPIIIPPVVSTTRAPSITVTSPIAGELLEIGKTYQIKWDSVNIPKTSNVSIELLKLNRITNRTNKESNLRVYTYSRYGASYIGNVLNDGIERWTVPSNIEVGGQYIIHISGCSTIVNEGFEGGYVCVNTLETSPMLSVVGSSTATPISVIQPIVVPIPSTSVVTPIVVPLPSSITVTSPKKGQIWYPGSTYRVKWDSTLIDNKSVEIYISDSSISGSGSTNYITPNGVRVPNIGYYDWLVPPLNQLPGGGSSNYTIRVVESSTSISGISNSFGIADTNIMLDLTILIVRAGLFADIEDYVGLNGILKEVKTSINKLSPFVGRTSGEASALLGLIDNLNEQVLTLSLNINAENKTKIRSFIDQMGTLAQRLSPLLVSDSVAFNQYKKQQIADVSNSLSGVMFRLQSILRALAE